MNESIFTKILLNFSVASVRATLVFFNSEIVLFYCLIILAYIINKQISLKLWKKDWTYGEKLNLKQFKSDVVKISGTKENLKILILNDASNLFF